MSFWKILGSGDIWGAIKKLFSLLEQNPVLRDWVAQFANAEEQIALNDAATYAPQVFSGGMTMQDAITKLVADLLAKGISVSEAVVGNAIRTQLSSLQSVQPSPTQAP